MLVFSGCWIFFERFDQCCHDIAKVQNNYSFKTEVTAGTAYDKV